MLRDNLAGLIAPMTDYAGAHNFAGLTKPEQTGGCSRLTELAIVAHKRSWREIFQRKTPARSRNTKCRGLARTAEAYDSRAVFEKEYRTIDPLCLENPRPEGAESKLTGNAASPFPAEPRHILQEFPPHSRG
jgi:hypothetical protein